MDAVAYYSNLAMVTSAVLYLLALVFHALEWASARQVDGAAAPAGAATQETAWPTMAYGGSGTSGSAGGVATLTRTGPSADDAGGSVREDRFGRIGVAVTVVAALVHIVAVVLRGIAAQRAPWGNMYEFITSSMAMAAVIYLVGVFAFRLRGFGLPFTLLASIGQGLAVTVFYVNVSPLMPALHSVWFVIHIVAAALAGAAFNVGAIASLLYLLKVRAQEKGRTRGYLARLPEPAVLDRISYRLHAFAFPLWTFAIAAGAIWAQYAWGRFWGWDPKETWSLVTWIVYAAYLHARATAGWKGKRAAVLALIGIIAFWWNFVGVNLVLNGLHSYAGI
ncbi:MAG: c-type cytochrome biogenesis protein CcsB [Propionicimonas sp.]|uniref:c-type cytochrome biogenesis protein CcsB n=1 Tax=Propionicimonas sp. TaxID=1955623 RepID=UPI002B1FF449|nr:c-type cytochrome biogenesis protein CcsB [Propionicimonas sp.]MEA4944927.1 c-type cytochrome biogenesis protein CcsB [Propionicimonas sp.]MEA5055820.1 c-type cytochrome biogenesis protein CcsB [Propionicimonas sp.]